MRHPWKDALFEGTVSGSLASLASAVALVEAGQRELDAPAAPVNAISHWLWQRRSFREDGVSRRFTLTGYLIHHAASIFWATLHARAWGRRRQAAQPGPAIAGAAVTAAVACFVDYRLTPERLTPGFEHRLSSRALVGVYACFALGLALGSIAARTRR
jgi:hypothetical protein